jgi:hypothetical protein
VDGVCIVSAAYVLEGEPCELVESVRRAPVGMSLSPALSGDPADPIDRLMWATGLEVLRLPAGDERGGEYDDLELVSARTRRRLAGARLVSVDGGMWADVLHQVACERLPELERLNHDEFVSWYVGECLDGLDYRASVRAGARWEDQVEPEPEPEPCELAPCGCGRTAYWCDCATRSASPAPVVGTVPAGGLVVSVPGAPGWFVAWMLRTVHAPKLVVLEALGRWAWAGGPVPVIPDASWAPGLVAKFERRAGVTL